MEDVKNVAAISSDENWLKGKNKYMFILFAEFLGYVSPLIEWAEAVCNGENVEEYKQKLLLLDADYLLKKMNEDFSLNDLKGWWDTFYPYLEQFEDAANPSTSELPY